MSFKIRIWDFNLTPYENVKANAIMKNSFYNAKAKAFREGFEGVKDGDNIGEVDIANWFHKEFGSQKPLCLWDKLMREIGRLGEQIGKEVERFAQDISDELSRFSKRASSEIQRELDDVVDAVESIGKELNRAWDKLTGGCFITTATLYHLGVYEDNCYELTLIRKVRDEWLINQPHGKQIIEIYYKLAPKIVKAIGDDPIVYKVLWDKHIEPFFIHLENNEYEKALDIYITMVSMLKARYGL